MLLKDPDVYNIGSFIGGGAWSIRDGSLWT